MIPRENWVTAAAKIKIKIQQNILKRSSTYIILMGSSYRL